MSPRCDGLPHDETPGGTADSGGGESPTDAALATRRAPEAGKRPLEARGDAQAGEEPGEASFPVS